MSLAGVVPAPALSPSGDVQTRASLAARPREVVRDDNRPIHVDACVEVEPMMHAQARVEIDPLMRVQGCVEVEPMMHAPARVDVDPILLAQARMDAHSDHAKVRVDANLTVSADNHQSSIAVHARTH